MDTINLSSREYDFNKSTIEPLEIYEDPSGLLHGGVGSTVWDTAIVLAKYLEKSSILSSVAASTSQQRTTLNILELGSGTGLVGLAIARMLSNAGIAARIVLTDKENVLPLLQRNMDKNPSTGIELEARVLDWEAVSGIKAKATGKALDDTEDTSSSATGTESTTSTAPNADELVSTEWDLVILSDCIWFPALYAPLTGTLTRLLKPGSASQLIVAFEKRNFSEEMEFFAALGKSFTFRDVKPEEQDPNYQSDDIFLFLCQRRP